MSKLYFLRRTKSEIQIFGGSVFADIDGKQIGEISTTDVVVDVEPGEHVIKMYKSHTYDTYIGFAEVKINVDDNKNLTLRYSAPMIVTQPGHIVVADFTTMEDIEREMLEKEYALSLEKQNSDQQIEKQEKDSKRNNTALGLMIAIPSIIALLWYAYYVGYVLARF